MPNYILDPLENAIIYASRGWFVFPLHTVIDNRCSCERVNCQAPGKHPWTKNGYKDATLELSKIREWWGENPDANVGIVTGQQSGFFAVDVDPRNRGDESLAHLEQQHGLLPETVQALTGGGGKHILFTYDKDAAIGSRTNFVRGIDIKSNGGYIVAPPSKHVSGRRYTWDTMAHPDDIPISRAPTWLLRTLSNRTSAKSVTDKVSSSEWKIILSEACQEGSRHTSMTRIIGHLLAKNVDLNIIAAMVTAFDQSYVNPPLGEHAVIGIVRDIAKRQMNRAKGRGVQYVA